MTTTWFTSDQHFDHANIIQYCQRPFADVHEMNAEMVRRWNERVRVDDIVYLLGDFTLGNGRRAQHFLDQLRGNILALAGGHDQRWFCNVEGVVYEPPLLSRMIDGHNLTLCHYPLRSWEASHYGAWHLHGHSHGTMGVYHQSSDVLLPPGQAAGWSADVSVDCWDFYPVTLEMIMEEHE